MANHHSFNEIWAQAVAQYETQSDKKVAHDPMFRKLESFEDFEKYIHSKDENFTEFRDQHRKLCDVMAKALKPIAPVLDIAKGIVSSTPYAPAATAFGAAAYLLQACETVTKCYDAVVEVFEQLANTTTRLKIYDHGEIDDALKAKMSRLLAFILEIIAKIEKVVKRKRIKQWARSLIKDDDEIKPSLEKLRRFVDDELAFAIALMYTKVGDVKQGINEVLTDQRSDRLRVMSEADDQRVKDALSTPTADLLSKKYNTSRENLTKGTSTWIEQDIMFQDWLEEKAPILWVMGPPGVGKTMLATRTIESLKTKCLRRPDNPSLTSVCYLYFKDDDVHLQDCTEMWKAAALQIVLADSQFKKHVLETLDKEIDTFASPRRMWDQLFLKFFTGEKSTQGSKSLVYIIVDGLDEAPEVERSKFLNCLADMTKTAGQGSRPRIQVAIFARPEIRGDAGADRISSHISRTVTVSTDKNHLDIGLFIKKRLKEVKLLRDLKISATPRDLKRRIELAKHIHDTVRDKARGMFQWAKLAIDQIRDLSTVEAVEEALHHAPLKLDDMLNQMFIRLENKDHYQEQYFRHLLTWVLCTYRPLSVAELFVLLRLTTNQRCFAIRDDVFRRYSSIFDVSGPSIEDDESGAMGVARGNDARSEAEDTDDEFDFLDTDDSTDRPNHDDKHEGHDATVNEKNAPDRDGLEDRDAIFPVTRTAFEDSDMIRDSWHANIVTFTHASIREFLEKEFDPSGHQYRDCSLFNHAGGLREAKCYIAAACIEIMRADIARDSKLMSLVWYARRNWAKHLLECDDGEVGSEVSIKLARIVAAFFNDGPKLTGSTRGIMDSFTNLWFGSNTYSAAARRLIADHIDFLEPDHQEWARRVKLSTRALFEPMVKFCAVKWLTKPGFDDMACFDKSEREAWLLFAFNSLNDDGINQDKPRVGSFGSGIDIVIPLTELIEIANLVPLPKTAHWYVGVGWILMEASEYQHTLKAIEYYNTAIEMAEDAWLAHEGLAVCKAALGDYEEAVAHMNEAIRLLLLVPKFARPEFGFHLRSKMGAWQRQLNDPQKFLSIARQAFEDGTWFQSKFPYDATANHHVLLSIRNYIQALYDMNDFDGIVQLLLELDKRTTASDNVSMWIVFLRSQRDDRYDIDIFDTLTTVVGYCGKDNLVKLVQDNVERTVALTPEHKLNDGDLWLLSGCIKWLFKVSFDQRLVVNLCEKAIESIDTSDESTRQHATYRRGQIETIFSTHLFDKAVSQKTRKEDCQQTIAKLDGLAHYQHGSDIFGLMPGSALLMGRWMHEQAEEGKDKSWMAYFRPTIHGALNLLGDENPAVDQYAYALLGRALLYAGDIPNAKIALGITTKPLEVERASKSDSLQGLQSAQGDTEVADEHDISDEVTPGISSESGDSERVDSTMEDDVAEKRDFHEPDPNTGHQAMSSLDETGKGPKSNRTNVETNNKPPNDSRYAGFIQLWRCDGCGHDRERKSRIFEQLHFCRVCCNTCFCDLCILALQSGTLDSCRFCNNSHDHVQIFPVSEEARRVTDALMEQRYEVQEEWIKSLRKTWGDGDTDPEISQSVNAVA